MTVLIPIAVQIISLLCAGEIRDKKIKLGVVVDDDLFRINRFSKEAQLVKKGNKNDLIPNKLITEDEMIYPVTSCDACFLYDYELESLTIQGKFNVIGVDIPYQHIERCSQIKRLTLDFGDEYMDFISILQTFKCLISISTTERCNKYVSAGNKVFSRDEFNLLYCARNSNHVTINEYCKKIGEHAFYSCQYLTFIAIPASVTEIANNSFSCCTRLRKIKFSAHSRLKSIGCYAFTYTDLRVVYFPESLETISESAFGECRNLRKLIFPENSRMQNIGFAMVSQDMSLSIIIPNDTKILSQPKCYNSSGYEFRIKAINNGRFLEIKI